VGKLADFAMLSANPLTVPPATIKTIHVTETIKEGKTVWKRPATEPGTSKEP
jgi:predicted amidohydrolase YtcJ